MVTIMAPRFASAPRVALAASQGLWPTRVSPGLLWRLDQGLVLSFYLVKLTSFSVKIGSSTELYLGLIFRPAWRDGDAKVDLEW